MWYHFTIIQQCHSLWSFHIGTRWNKITSPFTQQLSGMQMFARHAIWTLRYSTYLWFNTIHFEVHNILYRKAWHRWNRPYSGPAASCHCCCATMDPPHHSSAGPNLHPGPLKGVDIYREDATVTDIFGEDLKGRMLQEAIWSTYQA